jgi:hypothetical protein
MDSSGAGALRLVSNRPLVFTVDHFFDAASCAAAEGSLAVQLAFRQRVAALFGDQASSRDGLKFNAASSADANNDSSPRVSFPDGVHVDTNNGYVLHRLLMHSSGDFVSVSLDALA